MRCASEVRDGTAVPVPMERLKGCDNDRCRAKATSLRCRSMQPRRSRNRRSRTARRSETRGIRASSGRRKKSIGPTRGPERAPRTVGKRSILLGSSHPVVRFCASEKIKEPAALFKNRRGRCGEREPVLSEGRWRNDDPPPRAPRSDTVRTASSHRGAVRNALERERTTTPNGSDARRTDGRALDPRSLATAPRCF